MDQIHRNRIDDLIEIVPYFIDMIALWPCLIQTEIFNRILHQMALIFPHGAET